MNFFDKNGMLHHLPNPTSDISENELLFTGEYVVLRHLKGFSSYEGGIDITNAYKSDLANNFHISHDNATGVMCARQVLGFTPIIPIFDKSRAHPRDIVMYGYAKYPFLFWWLLWIPSICMIISCYQNYKVRGGRKIIKTDGKILAFIRVKAFNMKITDRICTYLIKKNKFYGNWHEVFKRYFKETEHPLPELVKEYEQLVQNT